MVILFILGLAFIGITTFAIIKVSISCVFWSFNNSVDKRHIFKTCFPYYIISLTLICIGFIIHFNADSLAIYYFASVYVTALVIWKNQLKTKTKTLTKIGTVKPNKTEL